MRQAIFFGFLAAIIAAALIRSAITTGLDSFTYDEAYHVGAGVSYAKTGDFRLNPEHPPLVKLWTGAYVSMLGYNMSPFRALADKVDERAFVENDVYNLNDHDVIQNRARTAMFALNAILLFGFALAVRSLFGEIMALAVAAFFAIDPTVAAHMPVVMTDLPVALLAGTSVLLAVRAFQSWKPIDLALAAFAAGLALSAKHSAVIMLIAVSAIGVFYVFSRARGPGSVGRVRRAASVAAVLAGSVFILWGTYYFHYYESPATTDDQFNRPLSAKISDVKSPVYRAGLNVMYRGYLFPRSYTWGMADTIRAGAEGRVGDSLVFGQLYYGTAPWFFAPIMIAVKLPLGMLALVVVGGIIVIMRRVPNSFLAPIAGLTVFSGILLYFFIKGSSYGGIRHLLPIYPLLAICAASVVFLAATKRSVALCTLAAVCLAASLVLAVPVMRPWEYFNEIAGGTANAHRLFDDEGVDLYQRGNELRTYYHDELKPEGIIPYVFYLMPDVNDPAKTIDVVRASGERDRGKWDGPTATGTFIIGANEMAPAFVWDKKMFRDAEPIKRFGNLFVYRGTFDIRPLRAQGLAYRAAFQIYGPEPDIERAIEMLSESYALDPKAFSVALELGNQYLKLGNREAALGAYESALNNTPDGDSNAALIAEQIERLKRDPIENIQPLRNPALE